MDDLYNVSDFMGYLYLFVHYIQDIDYTKENQKMENVRKTKINKLHASGDPYMENHPWDYRTYLIILSKASHV